MDYFAGLDISMDETHICVLDREGAVVYVGKSASMAEAIADDPSRIRRSRDIGAYPSTPAVPSAQVAVVSRPPSPRRAALRQASLNRASSVLSAASAFRELNDLCLSG